MDNLGLLLMISGSIVLGTVFTVMLTRRRTEASGLSRLEESCVGIVGTGALLVIVGNVLSLIVQATEIFQSESTMIRGLAVRGEHPLTLAEEPRQLMDSGVSHAWVTVRDLPLHIRWMLYGEVALPALSTIAISLTITGLAIVLLQGKPFARSLPTVLGISAIAVLIGGMGSQAFASLARSATVSYLGVTPAHEPSAYDNLAGSPLSLDPSALGWALGLALIAAAFRIGVRLQRETEGLV